MDLRMVHNFDGSYFHGYFIAPQIPWNGALWFCFHVIVYGKVSHMLFFIIITGQAVLTDFVQEENYKGDICTISSLQGAVSYLQI